MRRLISSRLVESCRVPVLLNTTLCETVLCGIVVVPGIGGEHDR